VTDGKEQARMEQLAVNEMTTYRWSFEEDVQHYAAAGIAGIGVWRQKLSDYGEDKGLELLRESGLRVSSLLWAGGFTGSDGRTHRESVDDAREAIRLAGDLRAGCLVVYTGARAGHTHNHARRLIRGALTELAPLAEEAGVPLAIEPMHIGCAAEWTFLTELDDTLALLDAIGSPQLKLTFDTYHLGQDERILPRLPEIAPRIALVQLGDAKSPPQGEQNRCRIGEGQLPLRRIIATLRAAGYRGFFEVELMGEEIEASDYRELLTQSKQAVCELLQATTPQSPA
jgi:sugar phosphate isomerase/epimerase